MNRRKSLPAKANYALGFPVDEVALTGVRRICRERYDSLRRRILRFVNTKRCRMPQLALTDDWFAIGGFH